MRYAYKKAVGITTRDLDYGTGVVAVHEDSRERLQELGHHDLYMEAERFAHGGGILENV